MASYVGLDLSPGQARIVEAEGSAKKLKIKRFARVEFDPSEDGPASSYIGKEVGDVVGKAFSKNKIAREPIAMSWDSDHTIFREMDLPFTSYDQISKVIKYEAESHLLNCDIDDVVVSFYKLREERDKSHLLVMAVRKDQLLNRFDVLGRAGVDPIQVDLDVMAAFNALSAIGYTEEHGTFMVLDCGRRTTNLLLISNGRLVSGRAIRLGRDSMTRRLAADLGSDPAQIADQASGLLEDPAKAREDDLMVPMSDALGVATPETAKAPAELAHDLAVDEAAGFYKRLTREINRTLVTTRLPESIEAVFVTGPGSLLPGFHERVEELLPFDAPVQRLDLLGHVDCDVKGVEPEEIEADLLIPLGLAFKAAGRDDTSVDFRQEECRYARKFDQIREPLLYFCGFLLFLVLLLNLFDIRKLSVRTPFLFDTNHADLTRIHQYANTLYKSALGKSATLPESHAKPGEASIDFMRRKMSDRIDELKGELGRGGSIPEMPSAFHMWKDAFDAIGPYMDRMGKLWITDLRVIGSQKAPFIELTGYVNEAGAYSDLLEALGKIPGIVSVEEASTSQAGGRLQFKDLRIIYPDREDL